MTKQSFDPRKMMEKAVKVMLESISEHRDDSKVNPAVGAVLVKPDGTIDTASRGELRDGDHAEFTVLERKNRSIKLDDSVLFTTLEPCAPGARTPLKLSCAERIVNARIKEVWVGIEDPDPKADRKGIRYLQDKGIEVHLFDADLQNEIRSANKKYLVQARLRAAVAEEEAERVILSKQEQRIPDITFEEFSKDALEVYREKAKIEDKIDTVAFKNRLLSLELVEQDGDIFRPTGFGYILFGREPRIKVHHAGLKVTVRKTDSPDVVKDFDGPMVLIPNQLEKWIENIFPSAISRDQMERREIPALPFVLIREAVVNSLVHRNWDIIEAKCQLEVNSNTIVVRSPGKPVSPITLEQLQKFKAPTLSRNPKLHYIFCQLGLAEERGFGMRTWQSVPEQFHLPLPRYTFEDPYLVLTIYRSFESEIATLEPNVLKDMNEDEKTGWKFLATQIEITRADYEKATGFDSRKAQRHIAHFIELGLMIPIGSGRAIKYQIIKKKDDKLS